jgi:hypothetical protein
MKKFTYSRWRHGGWYVHEITWPNGGIGCVSNNYDDHKWRIACDPRPFELRPTYRTREKAAQAEWEFTEKLKASGRCHQTPDMFVP